MKDWQILLAVLVGVLLLNFLFRERFQDSPTGVRGPPYSDTDIIKILGLDLSKTDDKAASSDYVKGYITYFEELRKKNSTVPPVDIRSQNGRAKVFEIIRPYFEQFYHRVYAPATTPITEQQVRSFIDTNLPSSRPAWLNADQVENLKKLMKKYFVDQPAGPANAATTAAQRRAALHSKTSGFGYYDELESMGQDPTSSTQDAIFAEIEAERQRSLGPTGGTQQSTSSGSTGATGANVVNIGEALDNPWMNNIITPAISKIGDLKDELITIEKRITNNDLANVNPLEPRRDLNLKARYDSWDVVLKERVWVAATIPGTAAFQNRNATEAEVSEAMTRFRNASQLSSFPPDWFDVMEKITRRIGGLPDKETGGSSESKDEIPGTKSGNKNTSTGGSTTSSWGPSGSETAGGKGFNVFGPLFAGVGESSGGSANNSTLTNTYPELLGGHEGSGKTRVDGVGMINPSINAPGMNMNLPDWNTLGRSLIPGDKDPYRVAQTFSPSSYSSRGADPIPFLTDFSAFFK